MLSVIRIPINQSSTMEYHQGFLNGAHLLQNSPKNSQGLVGGPPINGTLSHSIILLIRGFFHVGVVCRSRRKVPEGSHVLGGQLAVELIWLNGLENC